jgi:hypothetical protein
MEKETKGEEKMQYSGKYRELFYSYDKDGNYSKEVKVHDSSDIEFIDQFWDVSHERIMEAKQKVLAGKASPIFYYMEKKLYDPMSLAMQAGISLWRLKRHLRPGVFKRLSEKTLRKYAEAFDIGIEELKHVQ